MSAPIFIHITSTGGVWVSNNQADTPTGTVTATFKVNSDAKFQQIGTISGTVSSSLTSTGQNGKQGKELS